MTFPARACKHSASGILNNSSSSCYIKGLPTNHSNEGFSSLGESPPSHGSMSPPPEPLNAYLPMYISTRRCPDQSRAFGFMSEYVFKRALKMAGEGIESVTVESDVTEAWNVYIQEIMKRTAWNDNGCGSWYKGKYGGRIPDWHHSDPSGKYEPF